MFILLVGAFVVLFLTLGVTFVIELLLAMKQQGLPANRPSVWLSGLAQVVRRVFYDLGWMAAKLPDVLGWVRHFGHLIRRLLFRWIPREVAERAIDDLHQALGACFRAPLGYFAGIWAGLWEITVPWVTWPLFILGTLATLFGLEVAAILYDLPAPLWPTWYVGLLGNGCLLVYQAMVEALRLLSDLPRFFYNLAIMVRDMVPDKVFQGLMAESQRLAAPWQALQRLMPVYPVVTTLLLLTATALVIWLTARCLQVSIASEEIHKRAEDDEEPVRPRSRRVIIS